jgi:hypothetical protein
MSAERTRGSIISERHERTAVRASTVSKVAVLDPPSTARLIELRPYRAGALPLPFMTASGNWQQLF